MARTGRYFKVPMGFYDKMIKLNRLSNYSLRRLIDGKLNRYERFSFKKVKIGFRRIIKQAEEILMIRLKEAYK